MNAPPLNTFSYRWEAGLFPIIKFYEQSCVLMCWYLLCSVSLLWAPAFSCCCCGNQLMVVQTAAGYLTNLHVPCFLPQGLCANCHAGHR